MTSGPRNHHTSQWRSTTARITRHSTGLRTKDKLRHMLYPRAPPASTNDSHRAPWRSTRDESQLLQLRQRHATPVRLFLKGAGQWHHHRPCRRRLRTIDPNNSWYWPYPNKPRCSSKMGKFSPFFPHGNRPSSHPSRNDIHLLAAIYIYTHTHTRTHSSRLHVCVH
jgi:hypothetical protein